MHPIAHHIIHNDRNQDGTPRRYSEQAGENQVHHRLSQQHQLSSIRTWYHHAYLGLYCSSCLSTLPDINEDHFINLESLAKVLVELTQQYSQRIKGEVSQLNLIKGEM